MMNIKSTLVALAALACAGTGHADIVTFTGDTTGGPTFNRPLENLSGLSGIGTDVAYTTHSFTVGITGNYTFLTTAAFDPFTLLYLAPADLSTPLVNALVANDDLVLGDDPSTRTSGFEATLQAGGAYLFVATGYNNTSFGEFSTTMGGPGSISALPEPQTYALLALGLGAVGLARRYARTATA